MITKVVHKHNLVNKFFRRAFEDRGDGSQENCERLVVEYDDHRCSGQVGAITSVHTSGREMGEEGGRWCVCE